MSSNHSTKKVSLRIKLNERKQRHPDGSIERWRDVPGYEGFYRVSDRGRVKSLTRTVWKRTRWGGKTSEIRLGRVLSLVKNKMGYFRIDLRVKKHRKNWGVHQLVILAFVGPRPDGMEACHVDGDSENNTPKNLKWGTHRENCLDMKRHGTFNPGVSRGEENGSSKLTSGQVMEIRKLYASGKWRQIDLANRYGVSQVHISRIIRHDNW